MLYGFVAHAQLIVTNTVETPAQLVQNVLVDASVTPTNITFCGAAASANAVRDQAAHFTTNFNPTNLGLNEGVLLTTGNAQVAMGPNDSGNLSDETAYPVPTDPDLQQLAGSITANPVRNAAILEFDFVATGLELNFDYVFASEEYPEYSNSGWNDAFGFFLSGPGITGPFTNNAKNIALLPSTTTPITINNVNNGTNNTGPCDNCAFYVNNGQGITPTANPHVQYDGFTTVLRATSDLICGETYHIKLAVGNVGDNSWDSAVFLKNFRIKPLVVQNNGGSVPICPGVEIMLSPEVPLSNSFYFVWEHDGEVLSNDQVYYPPMPPAVPDLPEEGIYTLTYYTTAGGCLLGTADVDLQYLVSGLKENLAPINICSNLPLPYEMGNIDPTAEILQSQNPAFYEISYYYTEAEAKADPAGPGIPIAELQDYTLESNSVTIWARFYELLTTSCITIIPLKINYSPEPSGSFHYDGPFCANPSAITPIGVQLDGLTPGGIYNTSSAGLVINPNTGAIDLAMSSPGSYFVNYHLAAFGTCPDFDVVNIPVNIVAIPSAPAIINNPVICKDGTVNLTDFISGTTGTLNWYTAATGGTAAASPAVDTTSPNVTDYFVSQTIAGGCESARSMIRLTVNAIPNAPVIAAAPSYCEGTAAASIPSLIALVSGTTGNLSWYDDLSDITPNVLPTPVTATTPGTVTCYVTQTVNDCESARAQVDVVIVALPGLPDVADVTYCQNDTNATPLTTLTGTNLKWYTTASGGVALPAAPTPSTLNIGDTEYYVSQTVNGCEGARALLTVHVLAPPLAPAVSPIAAVCAGTTVNLIDYVTPAGANFKWYTTPTGGVGSASPISIVTSADGLFTFYVSQVIGSCESPLSPISFVVNEIPAAPIIAAAPHYCVGTPAGSIASLTALVSGTTGTLSWYDNLSDTTPSPSPTPITAATAGTITYYVTQTVNNCESPRAQVNAVIDPLPAVPTYTLDQPSCILPKGTITANTAANLEYSIDGGINYTATAVFVVDPNATYTITVRNPTTGCIATSLPIVVLPAPTFPATPVATGTDVCINEQIQLSTPAVTGATYSWTGPNGFTSSDREPVISNADASMSGVYSVVISTMANCPSQPGSVTITVNPLPEPVLVQDGYICFNAITNVGETYVLDSTLSNALYDFEWFTNSTGSFVSIPAANQSTYGVTTPGTYAVQAKNKITGCLSAMVTATVQLSSPPLQLMAVSAEYFADVQSITINVSPPGIYEYQLDNGAFQSSSTFSDVLPGDHTVKVRNECGELPGSAYLLDFPRFFTPNGDNYNDSWNIFALCSQANAKIYIFDRYGKLLKQVSPCGAGWDGTFNDRELPGTDYWFTVEYEENNIRKEFKSHFALKR